MARGVARDVDVAVVRSVAPPVRRVEEIRPVAVRPVRDGTRLRRRPRAELQRLGAAGATSARRAAPGDAAHGEQLDRDGDLTTAHLDVDLPIFPEPLPLGQVDEVVSAG